MQKRISAYHTWFMTVRPSSLVISAIPVVMGTAMAFGDGIHHWPTSIIALLGAFLIHIGTNLTNDYGDLKHGADNIGDTDLMRGSVAVGTIPADKIKIACVSAFVLTLIPTYLLFIRAGWPVLIIAVCSILAGIFYTAGKSPLGYQGWGDIIVLVFFGPVALAGTYYVQSLEINLAVILSGFIPGLIGVAILTINNLRDFEKDKKVNKRTLVVRFGKNFGYAEYLFVILAASCLPILIFFITRDHLHTLWCSFLCLTAIPNMIRVLQANNAATFDKGIEKTAQFLIVFGIIYSIGWII